MRNYFIAIVLLFGAPLAFGDEMGDYMVDEVLDVQYDAEYDTQSNVRPTASDGWGRIFIYHKMLAQSLDSMAWFINFGLVIGGNWEDYKRLGPVCEIKIKFTSTRCENPVSSNSILDESFQRDARRRFHNTLTHLVNIDNVGLYLRDKVWEETNQRCRIYNSFSDIKHNWPLFLTAFRDDRRGLSGLSKEQYSLYFASARRTYSHYLDVMNKLAPDLRKSCPQD